MLHILPSVSLLCGYCSTFYRQSVCCVVIVPHFTVSQFVVWLLFHILPSQSVCCVVIVPYFSSTVSLLCGCSTFYRHSQCAVWLLHILPSQSVCCLVVVLHFTATVSLLCGCSTFYRHSQFVVWLLHIFPSQWVCCVVVTHFTVTVSLLCGYYILLLVFYCSRVLSNNIICFTSIYSSHLLVRFRTTLLSTHTTFICLNRGVAKYLVNSIFTFNNP